MSFFKNMKLKTEHWIILGIVTLGVIAVLYYFFVMKKEEVPAVTKPEIAITMPAITMPAITMPEIKYPELKYPSILPTKETITELLGKVEKKVWYPGKYIGKVGEALTPKAKTPEEALAYIKKVTWAPILPEKIPTTKKEVMEEALREAKFVTWAPIIPTKIPTTLPEAKAEIKRITWAPFL